MARGLTASLRGVALGVAELPGVRLLARPVYRHLFARDVLPGNAYGGVFASVEAARAGAPASLPTSYDQPQSGELYADRLERVQIVDYPVLFWLSRLFAGDARKLFDLGGNVGTSYFGFRHHLPYPDDLRWLVHDVPAVVAAGRALAEREDGAGKLGFTDSPQDADGCDVLLCSGVLQYLDYSLPQLLQPLRAPPRHVLVNVTPLHPERSFVTLQRVTRRPDHALHDVQIRRGVLDGAEDHDVLALGRGKRGQPAAVKSGQRDLQLAAEHRLVDEQEIADEQRILHARRWNAERLDEE